MHIYIDSFVYVSEKVTKMTEKEARISMPLENQDQSRER